MRLHLLKGEPLGVWRPWFAWRPVVISRQIVWLETVERQVQGLQGYYEYWDYRFSESEATA